MTKTAKPKKKPAAPVKKAEPRSVDIPARVLNLNRIGDRESSRYALGCVYVCQTKDAQRAAAVATDGRRLLAVSWPLSGAIESPIMVPALLCEQFVSVMDERLAPETATLTVDSPGSVTVSMWQYGTTLSMRGTQPEGRFPKWEDYVKERDAADEVRVEVDGKLLAELLATINDAKGSAAKDWYVELRFSTKEDGQLHLKTKCEDVEIFGALATIAEVKNK
jgi:hypothetical protein